jgi:hypothetical protein
VINLKRAGTDPADLSPQAPRTVIDGPPKRQWWRSRVGVAVAAAVVAGVGVAGYFGVNAVQSHPPSRTTAPPTSDIGVPVPGLPKGAMACDRIQTDVRSPFNAGARGTPATSCAFVEQVRKEYSLHHTPTSSPVELSVLSPATYRSYHLACFGTDTYVTCTGGAAAVIYLYNG